jgi:hypothetical protein
MNWQEQRRLNEAAHAEQARQDALNAAQVEQVRARTQVAAVQARTAQRAELARQVRADRQRERDAASDRRRARWASLRGWMAAHAVDLLIYPLAIVSAVMAVPAMATFGHDVYGNAAGYALPVITELGMWAFAFAAHLVRHRTAADGQDRPVWALQVGVWSFATVAAGLNLLHGAQSTVTAGVVMAVASVAGVMAHQLVTAAPRRGRVERDTEKVERQAATKVTRTRRAAVRAAVAEIGQDGTARLLFTPGHYRLTRSRFTPWRSARLAPAAVSGLPVTPALDEQWDEMDRALADMFATVDPHPGTTERGTRTAGGGVGTLDRDPADSSGDQPESTPIRRSAKRSRSAPKANRVTRSLDDLRAELHRLIEVDPTTVDPTSAESIRRALHCAPRAARHLRDTYTDERGQR